MIGRLLDAAEGAQGVDNAIIFFGQIMVTTWGKRNIGKNSLCGSRLLEFL